MNWVSNLLAVCSISPVTLATPIAVDRIEPLGVRLDDRVVAVCDPPALVLPGNGQREAVNFNCLSPWYRFRFIRAIIRSYYSTAGASSSPSSGSGSLSGASSGSSSGGSCLTSGIPAFDHVVLVIEENHNFGEIIGSNNGDPYINYLANRGVLFTNSFAITHPSEPNYFALFTGSTQEISDDNNYNLPGPSLAKELAFAGKTFVGYIETS